MTTTHVFKERSKLNVLNKQNSNIFLLLSRIENNISEESELKLISFKKLHFSLYQTNIALVLH